METTEIAVDLGRPSSYLDFTLVESEVQIVILPSKYIFRLVNE